MKKVSVIIPTYNCADGLSRALKSVLSQDHAIHEIIVVDDWSTDWTALVMDALSGTTNIIYVSPFPQKRSVSAARNLGLSLASGDYIAFLDSDDFWFPNKISLQFNALEPSYCGVCCDYLSVSSLSRKAKYIRVPIFTDLDSIRISNQLCTSGLLFKKSCIDQVTFSSAGHEDHRFIYDIIQKTGKSVVSVPVPLVYYQRSTGSLSSDPIKAFSWWVSNQAYFGNDFRKSLVNFFLYFKRALLKRL